MLYVLTGFFIALTRPDVISPDRALAGGRHLVLENKVMEKGP